MAYITEIQNILTEVDTTLRDRLKALGVDIAHVILAVSPDDAGVPRSNVGEDELDDMADLLAEITDGSATQRPDNEPLNGSGLPPVWESPTQGLAGRDRGG